jgi:ubiquinone/menaquinone biosynthesis C-methylase UbiE
MHEQQIHAVLPRTNHDELARQDFTFSFKSHISNGVTPGNRMVAEAVVLPEFKRAKGREPKDRHELRQAMDRHGYHQMWGSLTRLAQEVMWDSVEESVARQLPDLVAKARTIKRAGGSLTLDPKLVPPRYMSAVDIHAMPGGYLAEVTADDVRAGAIFDRGTFINVCGTQGPLHDARGRTIVSYLRANYPGFAPKRILDMGCSIGQGTLPYPEYFPKAEVHAIDVAAPLLRYAHARAESVGRRIHFSQQNAEKTNFAAGSFDLVVSHLLFHETSNKAVPNILRECLRLLRPGGMMLHLELGLPYRDMDLYEQVIHDWQTYNNGEPFWAQINSLDTAALAKAIGFAETRSGYMRRADDPAHDRTSLGKKPKGADCHPQGDRGRDEYFFVVQGIK